MKHRNLHGRSDAAFSISQSVTGWMIPAMGILILLLLSCNCLFSGVGTKRALLVGINDYIDPKIPDLRGAITDIVGMGMVLNEQFGFAENQIQILSDRKATRAAILLALNQLVEKSGPDDTLYFHFSGHGSQVKDFNRDEADGFDETIVPADARMSGIADITDDEINTVLSRMRTPHVIVVFDSCHSGTITRGFDLRTRTLPPDNRTELYEKAGSRALVALEGVQYVLMTGAASNESALDGPVPGFPTIHCGYFSYALIRALSQLGPRATIQEVYAGVKQIYASLREGMGRMQFPEPQLECPANRLPKSLFGSSSEKPETTVAATGLVFSAASKPFVEVRPYSPGHVLLVRGALMDAAPDSKWAIFPADEKMFERALAVASVTEIHEQDSVAGFQPSDAGIPSGAKAILIAAAPPPKTIPIHVLGNAEKKRSLEAAITQRMARARLVGAEEFARFVVELRGETEETLHLILYSAGGLQEIVRMKWPGETAAVDALVPYFTRNLTAAEITSLQNPSSGIKLDVGVIVADASRDLKLLSEGSGDYHIRRSSEQRSNENSLMLSIKTSVDCFLTVVDVDSEGRVVVLFPNALQHETFYPRGRIPANQAITIPDSLSEPNQAGFFWDYSPPAGMETVHVLASTDLETATTLRRYLQEFGLGANTLPASSGQRGSLGLPSLLERLRSELTRLPSRIPSDSAGARALMDSKKNSVEAKPAADWTGKSIMIEVRE